MFDSIFFLIIIINCLVYYFRYYNLKLDCQFIFNGVKENRIVLKKITQFIEQLDVAVASASVSLRYGYVRPKIKVYLTDSEKSYVDIERMRHPIGDL